MQNKKPDKKMKPTKNMLRNRLYDFGFSQFTMPSITRPRELTNSGNDHPLVARLYSLNNKLIREVKQKQTSLLMDRKKLKENDPSRFEQIWQDQMLLGCTNPIRQETSDNVSLNKRGDQELTRESKVQESEHDPLFGMKPRFAMNNRVKLPKVSGPKKPGRKSANCDIKQINEEELMRSKHLINQLRDTYLEKTKCYRTNLKGGKRAGQLVKNNSLRTSKPLKLPPMSQKMMNTDNPKFKARDSDKVIRQTELNTYIKLLQNKESEVDEFVYLIPRSKAEDPYDLELKTYFKIFEEEEEDEPVDGGINLKRLKKSERTQKSGRSQQSKASNHLERSFVAGQSLFESRKTNKKVKGFMGRFRTKQNKSLKKEYYTISNKGLCHFKEGQPIEFIPLLEWMKERETYYKIKNLEFFTKFRKWKTVIMWRKSCKNLKQQVARKSLKEKLFFNCPELKRVSFEVKKIFYELSQAKFINLNYTKEASQEIGTIEDFVNKQNKIAKDVQIKIRNDSQTCHEKVISAFEAQLDSLRNKLESKEENDVSKKLEGKMIMRANNNPYENLNFPENMSYDRRSELHKECYRFIRFSKLVDFLALNCLRTIHLKSLKYFHQELRLLNDHRDSTITRSTQLSKYSTFKKKEPLFLVQLTLNSDYPSLTEDFMFKTRQVKDFKYPKIDEHEKELRRIQYKDFNLRTFPTLINYDLEEQRENFNEQKKRLLEYTDNKTFTEEKIENIEGACLNFRPSADTFIQLISKMIMDGTQNLQSFESLSQNPSMKKYKAVLDEWDDQQDEKDSIGGRVILSSEEWVDQEVKKHLLNEINKQFESAFQKSNSFLKKFQHFLQIDYDYTNLDWGLLTHGNLARPAVTFNAVFNLLDYHEHIFNEKVPFQEDIGLLRIDSRQVKEYMIPRPQEIISILAKKIPEELSDRLVDCREWLISQMEVLKEKTSSIDIFVEQSKNLKLIEKRFPFIKDRLKTCREIWESIRKFQVDVGPEIVILFSKTKELEQDLDSEILGSNKSMAKNQEKFSKDIKEKFLPELTKDCVDLEAMLGDQQLIDHSQNQEDIINTLKIYETKLTDLQTKAVKLNSYEEVLSLSKTRFSNIGSLSDDLSTKLLLWTASRDWESHLQTWNTSEFKKIDVENVQKIAEKFSKHVSKCKKKIPLSNVKLATLDTNIKNFSSVLPVIIALNNNLLQPSHFKEINTIVGFKIDQEGLKLSQLLCPSVFDNQKQIIEVSVQVKQEDKLKRELDDIDKSISALKIPLKPFKEENSKDATYILDDCTKLVADIDKLIQMINSVYGSRYLKDLRTVATNKRKDILLLQDTLNEWVKFQKNYIYLESIFSQSEMRKSLAQEGKEFEENVNKQYKQNIKKVITNYSMVQLFKQKIIEQLFTSFKKQNGILHELNKKINYFLDSKRENFPRFYFIPNEELIFILANYDNPQAVQTFIGKLFQNVHKVDFGSESKSTTISSIISREGEVISLKSTVNIKSDSVDKWMKKLEDLIGESLYKAIRDGNYWYNTTDREQWFFENISQVLTSVMQIIWTETCENYLSQMMHSKIKLSRKDEHNPKNHLSLGVTPTNKNKVSAILSENEEEIYEIMTYLNDYYQNLQILVKLVKGNLTPVRHKILVGLITSEVHNRDVLEMLQKKDIRDITDFQWEQQLRYYFQETSDYHNSLTVKQINSVEKYGFEYHGPCSRMVVTPLNEKCWITITSALNMKLGASLAGPAGTGKTESIKDLAKALGRFCVVYNCSEQVKYSMMEKQFRGAVQQGAWMCLDEFNRIDIEVLSVIAQQLLEINEEETFNFCGSPCTLNENCGIFITMNPSYVGRSQLPDNLKALFRPIAMMIPNYLLIAEVQLFSEGFNDSKNLSSKMMKLYKLSSEQLSQKKHYDFGMRSIKSVLEIAGSLKRNYPMEDETKLLIRSLRDSNVPKFFKNDLRLFNALVKDLFPELELPETDHSRLKNEIQIKLAEKSLQPKEPIMDKICQIYDMIGARFGVVLLGNSLVGKTTSLMTLKESMTALYHRDLVDYQAEMNFTKKKRKGSPSHNALTNNNNYDGVGKEEQVEEFSPEKIGSKFTEVTLTELNPKAVSKGELFGQENLLTKDWTDGIASHYIRKAAENHDSTYQSWISFDGPVDSLWIEDMNSVLDQSRILCLSNGQRIRLNQRMRIIFEVNNLTHASLATITRCGMVYFPEDALGWDSILISWLKRLELKKEKGKEEFLLNKEAFVIISNLCDSFLPKLVEVFKSMPKIVPISVFQAVRTFCDIYEAMLDEERGFKTTAPIEFKSQYITLSFIFATAWAFGGCLLDIDNKRPADRIDALIKKRFNTMDYLTEPVLNCFVDPGNTILRPFNDLLKTTEANTDDGEDSKYSASMQDSSNNAITNFSKTVDGISCELESKANNPLCNKGLPFWEILVSTTDTLKISNVCSILCRSRRNVFLLGGSGAGKSVVSEKLLQHLSTKRQIDNIKFFFSAQTEASTVYEGVLSELCIRTRNVRGAYLGREMVIFVEDVNMPKTETYGAQPPIEILRQLMDKKMLYHKEEMEEIRIVDTSLFVLAAPPEGGKHPLDPRFMGHFGVVAFPLPRTQTIQRIFSNILETQLVDFEDIVRNISSDIVQASVEFYENIIKTKRPTPSKFHYTFNLRDLSRVFMGLSRADDNSCRDPQDLITLWGHEMTRVFHDRLLSKQDRTWFFETLNDIIERIFKIRPEQIDCRNSLFSDIYSVEMEETFYEQVFLDDKLVKTFSDFQIDFNECPGKKLELVFFDYAVRHLIRILRILSQSRGNGLLIGVGGLGKQSLTRLAAFILKQETKSLPGMNKFNREKFREWLYKEVLVKCAGSDAGPLGVPTCLIVSDGMISSETILEYMSNLLNSGEVPNIFPEDDQKKLLKGLFDMYMENVDDKTLWKRFVSRVRDNLHIMMCMSPVGDNLRFRCRQFPALIDCCSINWFDDWESSAVENVSIRILESTEIPMTQDVAHMLRFIHEYGVKMSHQFMKSSGRKCFITPKNALDNVELVNRLYTVRKNKIQRLRNVLVCGSFKLEETSKLVAKLKVDLKEAQPLLEQKRIATEVKMKELEKATIVNQEKRQLVEQEKKKKQSLAEQIESFNNDVEQQLSKVRPVIDQAENDVRNINPKDIFNLRIMPTPAENIENVMRYVCITLGIKYVSWKTTGLKVLNDTNKFIALLIGKIEEIKINGSAVIPNQTMMILTKALRSKCFSNDYLSKNSFARPLGMWVRAIYEFVELKKTVEPLEKQAKKIDAQIKIAKSEYDSIVKQLEICKNNMNNLQNIYSSMEIQKKALETNIESTKLKLGRAEKLTSLLIDENLRWKDSIKDYDRQMKFLLSDAIMSASIISYTSPFDGQHRAKLLQKFKILISDYEGIIFSDNYSFLTVMGDPLDLKEWSRFGLPSDEESQTSALISQNSLKWPLMIDPQKQASTWLKNMFKYDEDFIVVSNNIDENRKLQMIKFALTNGKVVLLENVSEVLESSMDPVFNRQFFENKIEKRKLIAFNNETIDYHDDFQLFITTKISNPNFLPDIFIKMNVINFTVTLLGLEEQLLAEVVKLERPSVETQKNDIIEKVSNYKKRLLDFEQKILNLLADSDTLIEDEKLVSTLQSSKTTSDDIKKKVLKSSKLAEKIEEARECFRPVAKRGSILFFVVRDMSSVDSMYQYSLYYIIKIFKSAIRRSEPSNLITTRLQTLILAISREIYRNISRGLFERHKLIFSFLMSCRIGIEEQNIRQSSWEMFLRGASVFDRQSQPSNPDPSFISEESWDVIYKLNENNYIYAALCQSFHDKLPKWKKLIASKDLLEADFRDLLRVKSEKSSNFINSFQSKKVDSSQHSENPKSVRFGTEGEKDQPKDSSKTSNYVGNFNKSQGNSQINSSELESDTRVKTQVFDMIYFDKLLLVKLLKPDTLLVAISKYVEITMGKEYLSSNSESLDSCKSPMIKNKAFFKKKSEAQNLTMSGEDPPDSQTEQERDFEVQNQSEEQDMDQGKGSLQVLVETTDPETPIIFVLTRGADPSSIVKKLGDKMGFYIYEKLLTISLGQEQGPRAEKLILRAQEEGLWVMLENCHLAKSWLPKLEELIEELQDKEKGAIHRNFRLFLTSMPAEYFPVSILENGVKITTEPPKGLRNNMTRSIAGIQDSFFSQNAEIPVTKTSKDQPVKSNLNFDFVDITPSIPQNSIPTEKDSQKTSTKKSILLPAITDPNRPSISTNISSNKTPKNNTTISNQQSSREQFSLLAKSRLVTSLSLFHAIIQERKNFGAIGWNKPYDFNDSDFFAVKDILHLMVEGTSHKRDIPWDSLFFLTGVITYGGRVTDNQDKRLLKCLLKKFFNEQVLDERCRFWADKRYKIPRVACKNDILDYVESLPSIDPPEICGLHPNATISFQKQETSRIINTLIDICPQSSKNDIPSLLNSFSSSTENLENAGPDSADNQVKSGQIILIENILSDLPKTINPKHSNKSHLVRQSNGLISPLSTVLFQEIERFNRLIRTIRELLKNLITSTKGLMSITPELDEVSMSLNNNRVPKSWKKVAYPSLKNLGSWLKDLKLRVEFMSYWMVKGNVPNFWLPGFFFPQGFLTGVLQTHSRKLNMPVDKFSFLFKITDQESTFFFKDFKVSENSSESSSNRRDSNRARNRNQKNSANERPKHNFQKKRMTRFAGNNGMKNRNSIRIKRNNSNSISETLQPDGVFISGLFLEGADWDKRRKLLVEQSPGKMHYSMPLVHFLPSEKAENKGNWYSCPLYKTPDRRGTLNSTGTSTNFILDVTLPCDKNRDLWVLRGVALFCEIND